MASEFFGRQCECRFYTAGCGNKMAVSATGPRAANELGGPVIPSRSRASLPVILLFMQAITVSDSFHICLTGIAGRPYVYKNMN